MYPGPMRFNTRATTPIHPTELARTLSPWPIKPVELSSLGFRFEVSLLNVSLIRVSLIRVQLVEPGRYGSPRRTAYHIQVSILRAMATAAALRPAFLTSRR